MVILLLVAGLLTGCSGSDDFGEKASTPQGNTNQTSQDAIKINTVLWQVTPAARRATTIDNLATLQTNGFRCFCYFDGTTNQFINGSTMSYANSAWSFDDNITRYWPYSEALNFFAYAPKDTTGTACTFDATPYDGSTNTDGYSDGTARLVCSGLPVSVTKGGASPKELLVAFTADQTRAANAAAGVTLNFKHPLTGLAFTLDEDCRSTVKVNKITITGIYNSGTCTFNGTATWTPTGTQDKNFVLTGSPVLNSSNTSDGTYLVLPQTFKSAVTFTVNATWTEWGGDFTKDVSTTVTIGSWLPGYKYTYNLKISKYAIQVETESTYTEQW